MMNNEGISFNLVEKPWVPCIKLNGDPITLSLKDVFNQAHELREFTTEHPLTISALMGILHCVIYRATDGPKDTKQWAAMLKTDRFGTDIQDYLTKQRDRFDLFSPHAPFYQTTNLASLEKNDKLAENVLITKMVQQLASGNNKTVFDHTLDRDATSLTPAETVLALITFQNAALRGLISKKNKKEITGSDAQLSNGMVIMLKGRTLFDMIMLNLLPRKSNDPVPSTKEDCAVWDLDPKTEPVTGVVSIHGYMHLLTPKCRHILLIPEIDGGKVVVRRMHIAQGEVFRVRKDPRFAYSKPKEEGRDGLPRKMQSSRVLWRDSEALFGLGENRPQVLANIAAAMDNGFIPYDRFVKHVCIAYGMISKKAKISDWRNDRLQVPASIFIDKQAVGTLLSGVDIAEDIANHIGSAISKAVSIIMPKAKDDRKKLIKQMSENSKAFYWQEIDLPFQRFILALPDDGSAFKNWFSVLQDCAETALRSEFETMNFDFSRHMQAWVKADEYLNGAINKLRKQKGVMQ
jgi:CRISPR system Cascade subunit CasA